MQSGPTRATHHRHEPFERPFRRTLISGYAMPDMCDVFQRGVEWIVLNQRTTMNGTNVEPLCACEAFNCLLQRIIRIGLGGTHDGLKQRTRGSGEGLIRRQNCLTEQSEGANLDRPES